MRLSALTTDSGLVFFSREAWLAIQTPVKACGAGGGVRAPKEREQRGRELNTRRPQKERTSAELRGCKALGSSFRAPRVGSAQPSGAQAGFLREEGWTARKTRIEKPNSRWNAEAAVALWFRETPLPRRGKTGAGRKLRERARGSRREPKRGAGRSGGEKRKKREASQPESPSREARSPRASRARREGRKGRAREPAEKASGEGEHASIDQKASGCTCRAPDARRAPARCLASGKLPASQSSSCLAREPFGELCGFVRCPNP